MRVGQGKRSKRAMYPDVAGGVAKVTISVPYEARPH